MTNEQRAAIRARCEAGRMMKHDIRRSDQVFIQWIYEDVAALLDALDEADEYASGMFREANEESARLRADLDKQKARAAALERALKGHCDFCLHQGNDEICVYCKPRNSFRFDQARFSK